MTSISSWKDVRAALETHRDTLNAEISVYPAPIPGCDAQFNHLLEERARINRELGRLESEMAKTTTPAAISEFIDSCPFLTGAGGEKHT